MGRRICGMWIECGIRGVNVTSGCQSMGTTGAEAQAALHSTPSGELSRDTGQSSSQAPHKGNSPTPGAPTAAPGPASPSSSKEESR